MSPLLLLLAALATAVRATGVCDGLSITNSSQDLLRGRHLVVCEIDYPPFAMTTATMDAWKLSKGGGSLPESVQVKDGWSGMDIEMLEMLSFHLGFTYEIEGKVKAEGESNWADMLGRILPECDMIGTYWTHTAGRRNNMLFMIGHIDYSSALIVRKPKTDDAPLVKKLYTFMMPFSASAWVALAAMTIASGFVMYLLEVTQDRTAFGLRNQLYKSAAQCLWGGFADPTTSISVPYHIVNGFIVLILVSACTSAWLRIEDGFVSSLL